MFSVSQEFFFSPNDQASKMVYSLLEKRILNIDECSQYLGITKGTLYVWVCHKKIPYLKAGRLVKFDLIEIEKWIKEKSVAQLN